MIRLSNATTAVVLSVVLMSTYSAIGGASDIPYLTQLSRYFKSQDSKQYYVERGIDAKAVFMGNGDFIQMAPGEEDQNRRSIFSFGFGGCTGTVLYVLLKNGEQRAALTHYPPTSTPVHLSKMRELINQLKNGTNCDEIVKAVGIVFSEGIWAKNPETGYYSDRIPCDASLVDRLKELINAEFGCSNTLVIQELYKETIDDQYHPGGIFADKVVPKELEIVLSPNSKESYFHSKATWHKKQKLSDL